MKTAKAFLFAGGLSVAGAAGGYSLTPGQKADELLTDEAKVFKVPARNLNESPDFQKANQDVESILLKAGIDPALIAEAKNNPNKPIPRDWWVIIMKFLTMGAGLSIDVAILTVLMERLKTPADKAKWAIAVPGMHWLLPEATGHTASAFLNGWPLSFTATACFVALLYKMHGEGEEEKKALTATLLGTAAYAGSVSIDAAAAGPGIAQQAAELGITQEIANSIQAFGGVLACTAVAIGLQKYKDRLLEIIDQEKAETYGKALATGAFSLFLFDCLADGLKNLFGANIPPDVQNAAVAGLAAITPVLSYQYLTKEAANAQVADIDNAAAEG